MKRRQGFTLVEVILVVVVIGVLASLALPRLTSNNELPTFMSALAHAQAIQMAEKQYWIENGDYTKHIQDLDVNTSRLQGFRVELDKFGVATLTRINANVNYSIQANPNGVITCTNCPAKFKRLLP